MEKETAKTAKLQRRLSSAKRLAVWEGNSLVRAFGRMMVRRLTAALKQLAERSQLTN